jgi:hypothetical protein
VSTTLKVPIETADGAPTYAPATSEGGGWIVFTAVMFFVAAALNMIWGIAAVSDSRFFVGDATFILSTLNTWGWVTIGFAVVEALAGALIWFGSSFGRWLGIALASLALILAMMSIPAYPLWALVLVAINGLVIYALAVYGGKPELTA